MMLTSQIKRRKVNGTEVKGEVVVEGMEVVEEGEVVVVEEGEVVDGP